MTPLSGNIQYPKFSLIHHLLFYLGHSQFTHMDSMMMIQFIIMRPQYHAPHILYQPSTSMVPHLHPSYATLSLSWLNIILYLRPSTYWQWCYTLLIGSPHHLNSEFTFYMHSEHYLNITTHFQILFHFFAAYSTSSQLIRTSKAYFGNFRSISDL
jgi:hypothetical protein